MASSQAILSALSQMQTNTQAALPVIPNNGNPGGAYNSAAPQPTSPPTQLLGQPAFRMMQSFDWLKPSPYMQMVNQYLSSRPQVKSASQAAIQPPEVTQAPATSPSVGLPAMPKRIF